MANLTFRFSGVCTHFRNGIVPGVPHRVVLPDLTKVLFGSLQILEEAQGPVLYYTTPHFSQFDLEGTDKLAIADLTSRLNVPNLLVNGDVMAGLRLQVVNATDKVMSGDFDGIHGLREFLPTYAPSSDVVLNGNANCYIDLFGGFAWVTQQGADRPPILQIKVTTDGPPRLMFTPLTSSLLPGAPPWTEITLPENFDSFTMTVKNLEAADKAGLDSTFDQGMYDYLLHYVTAQGGRPPVLISRPPGVPESGLLPGATLQRVGAAFQTMGDALNNTDPTARRRLRDEVSVTPACADSMYP